MVDTVHDTVIRTVKDLICRKHDDVAVARVRWSVPVDPGMAVGVAFAGVAFALGKIERQRDGETERRRDGETDRQTDRQTEWLRLYDEVSWLCCLLERKREQCAPVAGAQPVGEQRRKTSG